MPKKALSEDEVLKGVYRSCRGNETGEQDLSQMRDHVFGNLSLRIKACEWCQSTFETRRDYQLGLFGPEPLKLMREVLGSKT